jgi:hypothetical protein
MSDDPAGDYEVLRAQTAQMLNLDLTALCPADGLRLDLTALLRLSLDSLQGQALSGREVDLSRLQSCYAMLSKLLPSAVEAPPLLREDHSARRRLAELLDAQAEVLDRDKDERIAELTELVAEKDRVIAGKDATIITLGGSLSAPQAETPAPSRCSRTTR